MAVNTPVKAQAPVPVQVSPTVASISKLAVDLSHPKEASQVSQEVSDLEMQIKENYKKLDAANSTLSEKLYGKLEKKGKDALGYVDQFAQKIRRRKELSPESAAKAEGLGRGEVDDYLKFLEKSSGAVKGKIDLFDKMVAREIAAIHEKYAGRRPSAREMALGAGDEAKEIIALLNTIVMGQKALLDSLKGLPKSVARAADEYLELIKDMQADRLKNATNESLSEKGTSVRVEANDKFIPEGKDLEKLHESSEKLGITYSKIEKGDTAEFSKAFRFLMQFFGADELDPPSDLMGLINSMHADPVRSTHQIPHLKKDIFQRYYLITANDKDGNIVAAADGNTIADKDICNVFLSHIAVAKEHRRKDIATMLESAIIGVANQQAVEAEKVFGTTYKTSLEGNKVTYMYLETEAPNRISHEDAALTFSRLMFHAANGFKVISGFRYAQVDLQWPMEKLFNKKAWNTVPLLLLVRKIGDEKASSLAKADALALGNQMEDYFHALELYSPDGIEFDRAHMFGAMTVDKQGNVRLIPLPTKAGEFREFLKECPAMDEFLPTHYSDHYYTKEYMKKFKAAMKEGMVMANEEVIKMLERKKGPPSFTSG